MHSFAFYFKKGTALASLLYSKRSFFDKFLLTLYFVCSVIGKFLFFLRPIFLIGDQNIALMLVEGHDVEVNKILEGVNDKKRYSSLLLASFFMDLMLIGTLIIVVLPMLLLGIYGHGKSAGLVLLIVIVLGSVVSSVLYLALVITYIPMGFVAAKGVDLSCGDILFLSKKASKGNRGLIVGLYVVYYLLIWLILGSIIGLIILFYMLSINVNEYLIIASYALAISIPIFEMFVVTRFRVALASSLYSAYNDAIETKHVVVARRASSSFEEYVAVFSDDMEEK